MKFSFANIMFFWALAASVCSASPTLIPLPQQMQTRAGVFTLAPPQPVPGPPATPLVKIMADSASQETAQYLALMLFKATGYQFVVATNGGGAPVRGSILLTTNSALASLGQEGYELTVAPDSVVIRGPGQAGLFYGVQSLLQLLPPEIYSARSVAGVAWTIPCVYIKDWPRFPWRGWMLDSVRHFFTVDEVKRFIDSLAIHKINVMHWHLDDDSGWRLEIKKWALLTQVGAWRTDLNPSDPSSHLWNLNPRSMTPPRGDGLYWGYYTQDQAREIVAYAAQRHITVVPEIEMPGHSTAALAAYPQFSCNSTNNDCLTCANGPYSLNVTSYVGGVFCVARPETMAFVQDVLTEVMAIFPGQYIHVGGDEVNFGNWRKHSLDQALTNSLGTTNMQVYQGYFTQQIANWIKSRGRTMIGWSEIFNGGLLANAAVMDWLNTRGAQAATNRQYAVMASSATLYINKWETANNSSGGGVVWYNEPPAQSGLCPLANVYAFEPVPFNVTGDFTNYILGAEGPNWSEVSPSLLNVEFRMYPRLSALAEVNWTSPSLKNFSDFANRLLTHQQRLARAGINYNPYAVPPELGTWTAAQISTTSTTLTWDITSSVTDRGEIDVSFCWKSGANGLDIAWAALLENGVEIDRDTHAGFAGPAPVKPAYVLRLRARPPGATYTLPAFGAGRGGTSSNGT